MTTNDIAPHVFNKIKTVQVNVATLVEHQLENAKINTNRNVPRLEDLPEYGKSKGFAPIAIVGGGPSLSECLDELRKFRTIIAAGSVHDYLISNNIIPTYAANCDPDKLCKGYFTKSHPEVKYLISSNSHPSLFEALKDQQIVLWHCDSDDQNPHLVKFEHEWAQKYYGKGGERNHVYHGVGGGCTIGLRSICLAINLGYFNLHLFGMDSCVGDANGAIHHAYEWADPEEAQLIEQVHRVRFGNEEGPQTQTYFMAGYQIAQLDGFKNFYMNFGDQFIPTFHGAGALPDYFKIIKSDIEAAFRAKGESNVRT